MSELGARHASAHHVAHPLPHTSEVQRGGRRAGPRAMARPIPYITCTVGTGVRSAPRQIRRFYCAIVVVPFSAGVERSVQPTGHVSVRTFAN